MANSREVFPTLADGTGAGAVLSKAESGNAAAGKVGQVSFAFKDSGSNLVLPTLTADGKLPVSLDSAGACVRASGKNTGSLSRVAVATITLTANEIYTSVEANAACTRTTLFEIIHNNNASEVELGWIIVGGGQFTHNFQEHCLEFTAGATGTQELIVYGTNLDKESNMYASISCLEKA
jgi:hypothetical protein